MSILAPHRATFRAIARTIVPEAAELDDAGWAEVEGTIESNVLRPLVGENAIVIPIALGVRGVLPWVVIGLWNAVIHAVIQIQIMVKHSFLREVSRQVVTGQAEELHLPRRPGEKPRQCVILTKIRQREPLQVARHVVRLHDNLRIRGRRRIAPSRVFKVDLSVRIAWNRAGAGRVPRKGPEGRVRIQNILST